MKDLELHEGGMEHRGEHMTPDKREVWFETFWQLVDESENYSTIDERITAREKLEEHVTQYHQDMMSEVVEALEGMKYKGEPSADASDLTWAGHHEHNNTLTEAQTIIKSLSK